MDNAIIDKIRGVLGRHYYLLAAPLIFMSFPSYDLWFLKGYSFFAWISLVPLLVFVKGRRGREVYFYSFVAGLAANFLTYRWIGNFAGKIEGGYTLIVAMLIPFMSVFFAARFFLAEALSRRFEPFRCLIYPSVWIVMDWVLSIGYLAFPWTYWGYSQHQFTPFIQMASITGILGVTFVIIAGNSVLSEIAGEILAGGKGGRSIPGTPAFRNGMIFAVSFIVIVVSGSLVLVTHERGKGRDLRVSVVQSCISPWENWHLNKFDYLGELLRYTGKALEEKPELVVWSESATLETISFNSEKRIRSAFDEKIFDLVKTSGVPLLTGEIGVYEERVEGGINRYPQNNAVLIDRGGVVLTYPKINLVPFGEWFPYEKWLPAVKRIATKYGGSDFIPGKAPLLFNAGKYRFGALICYEGIFHRLCRDYRSLGADFFVNITNDGWTNTYNGHMQHFSASPFRAVENGIWYVRAGNTGYSVIIDPYGRITSSIPILEKGALTGDLDFSMNWRTFYSKFGDLFLYAAMIFLMVLAVAGLIRKIRQGKA